MSLLNKLTADSTLNKKNSADLFTQIFDSIKSSVINRETVLINNFGMFRVERRKMQTMIDYNRKVVVLLPPKDKILFEFKNGAEQKETPAYEKADFPSKKIIAQVSANTKVDEITVYEFYNILFEVIREYLEGKRNVNIAEFGKFKINKKDKISFSPAKKFSEKVNYNFNNLKTQIIRSLNRDEIKKLYKESKHFKEEEYFPEETAEVLKEDKMPKAPERIPEIADKKDTEIPVITGEKKPDEYEITGDTILKENILMEDIEEEDIELKEKISTDFRVLQELFEEKEEVSAEPDEKAAEPELDIRIIQELEEAEELIKEKAVIEEQPEEITEPLETKLKESEAKTAAEESPKKTTEKTSPDYDIKEPEETVITKSTEDITETITEEPAEQPYVIKEKESPITEKIVTDFEEKIKMFRKKEEEERKSYEKILDKQKGFPEKSIADLTGIAKPPVEEIKQEGRPEISFAETIDKIMKDDEDDIELTVMKAEEEKIIQETFPDITETVIKEEEIKPEIISTEVTKDKDILITKEPPSKAGAAGETITDADDIPISQIYKKLRYGFPEEQEPKKTTEPVDTAAPEIEKPVRTITPKPEIPEHPAETSREKPVIPEEIPPVKSETDFSVKEDMHIEEGLTYEDKKHKFEELLKKYSEDFHPEEITMKIDDDILTEETQKPAIQIPDKEPDFKITDTPFKPVDESSSMTSADETLKDIKDFLDKFDKKESPSADISKSDDKSSPFKKIDDIDFPKSMDDYFEDIKKKFDKKDLTDKDEEI
ncbi:MAG: HU family DNA-binding protein [Ignavibacteria bacterium]|nr:HU family DNA-binding protein [Ignavibacteria bacterium]